MDDFSWSFLYSGMERKNIRSLEQIERLQLLECSLEANKKIVVTFQMNTLHKNCHYVNNCPHGMSLEPI